MDYLILTEKNSAFKKYEEALGGRSGKYEGKSYQLVHARGHLLELEEPAKQVSPALKEQYQSWDPENMPWNVSDLRWRKATIDSSAKQLLNTIGSLSKGAKAIVIATDNDPSGEGELLAWEIINAIGWQGQVFRIYPVDESAPEIKKAMAKPKDVTNQHEDGDYLKAYVRQRWDYLSMQLARLSTSYARAAGYRSVPLLSQGRLKSPILAFVNDREEAIANYVKKLFFEVKFKDNNDHVYARKVEKDDDQPAFRHADKADAEAELAAQFSEPGTVEVTKQEEKRQAPNGLLDLAKLDAVLSKQGFSSKLIQSTYQTLYEADYVSYPRTEDRVMTTEQFNQLVDNREAIAQLVGVDPDKLTHLEARAKLVWDQNVAHGANRPGSKVPSDLNELTQVVKGAQAGKCAIEIYRLLAMSALSILGEDYVYVAVEARIKEHPEFTTKFQQPKELNFKEIYVDGDLPKDQLDAGTTAMAEVMEGANPKPSKPTKAWLFKKLASVGKYGLGTGATQQSTVAQLTDPRSRMYYLKDTRGTLSLTPNGKMTALMGKGTMIADPEVTKDLFADMDAVGRFEKNPNEVLKTSEAVITHDMPILEANVAKLSQVAKVEAQPREKRGITFQGRTGKLSLDYGDHHFTDEEVDQLLAGESITINVNGHPMTGKLAWKTYKGYDFPGFQTEQADWQRQITFKGKTYDVNKKWGTHNFTDAEWTKLEAGKEITFEYKSKDITGKLIFKKMDNGSTKLAFVPSFDPNYTK